MNKRGRPPKEENNMKIKFHKEQEKIAKEETIEQEAKEPIIEKESSNESTYDNNLDIPMSYNEENRDIILSINVLNSNDLPRIRYTYDGEDKNAGRELYKFMVHLALELNPSSVLEISHDKAFGGILLHYGNVVDSTVDIESALSMISNKYDYIIIDIDPHRGQFEQSIYDKCKEIGYKGFIVYDDIYLTDGMKSFWNSIPEDEKVDITRYGHWSGSGIVNLNKNLKFILQ